MCLRRAFNLIFLISIFSLPLFAQEVFTSYVIINDEPFHDPVWVEYHPDDVDKSVVHLSPVINSLKETLSEEFIRKINSFMFDDGKIKILHIKEAGAEVELDLNSLDLIITVDKMDKKVVELSLSNFKKDSEIKNLVRPSFFSGYINLRGSSEFYGTKNEDASAEVYQKSNSLSLENVFNFGGLVFENQYMYRTDDFLNTKEWNRVRSKVVFDDQKRNVRYTLGDIDDITRGFQEIIYGSGVNIKKEFSITPNYFRSSFKKFKFYLDTNSSVEIYVNGNLVKRKNLPQGPVELSDFPFNSGENEVTIKVIDDFGEIKVLDFSNLNDSRILPVGMSDFNFSYLYQRRGDALLSSFKKSYNLDEPIFSGFYHRGISKNTVVGADWQYKKAYQLVGMETLSGDDEGLLKINIAHSKDEKILDDGFAARLEYESFLFKNGKLSSFRLLTSGEYREKGFSTLDSAVSPIKYILRASVGQNLKQNIRASLGVVKEWGRESSANRVYITSNFGWTFRKNFDLSSSLRVNLNESANNVVLISLNWYSPHNNQQLVSVYDPINKTVNAEYLTYPLEGRQNFRTSLSGEVNETSKRAGLGLDYFNQRFETRFAHNTATSENGKFGQNTQISFGTGLAFTSKSFSVTKPISNSFALVSLSQRPLGFSVPIGRGTLSKRGEINFWGPASLSNIAPYYLDRVNLDVKNLPYGYSLGKESFKFKPTYKSGTNLHVQVNGEVSATGRAVYEDKSPAQYIVGTVYLYNNGKKGVELQRFFTGGDGSFSIESLEKKTYLIEFDVKGEVIGPYKISLNKNIGIYEIKKNLVLDRGKK